MYGFFIVKSSEKEDLICGHKHYLKTQGINPDLIRKFDYLKDDSNLIIVAQIKGTHKKCPYCESKNTIIKEYKTRKIKG